MRLKSQHPGCNNGGFKYQEREKLRSASESLTVREGIITRVRETERQTLQRAEDMQESLSETEEQQRPRWEWEDCRKLN